MIGHGLRVRQHLVSQVPDLFQLSGIDQQEVVLQRALFIPEKEDDPGTGFCFQHGSVKFHHGRHNPQHEFHRPHRFGRGNHGHGSRHHRRWRRKEGRWSRQGWSGCCGKGFGEGRGFDGALCKWQGRGGLSYHGLGFMRPRSCQESERHHHRCTGAQNCHRLAPPGPGGKGRSQTSRGGRSLQGSGGERLGQTGRSVGLGGLPQRRSEGESGAGDALALQHAAQFFQGPGHPHPRRVFREPGQASDLTEVAAFQIPQHEGIPVCS